MPTKTPAELKPRYAFSAVLDWPELIDWGAGFIVEDPDTGTRMFWRGRQAISENLNPDLFTNTEIPVAEAGRRVATLVPMTPLGSDVVDQYVKRGVNVRDES